MNKLRLQLEVISDRQEFEYEGIKFTNCAFINIFIDDKQIIGNVEERENVVIWDELKKTATESGKYLIFTCICGIADDGGFDLISVKRKGNSVSWYSKSNAILCLNFKLEEYDQQIEKLELEINHLDPKIQMEPRNFIFPEN